MLGHSVRPGGTSVGFPPLKCSTSGRPKGGEKLARLTHLIILILFARLGRFRRNAGGASGSEARPLGWIISYGVRRYESVYRD